jgi:uncharacterized protein (DUF1330 family)
MEEHIEPSEQQLGLLTAAASKSEPVYMLNLLRFSDAEAYGRYAQATGPHLQRVGGEVVWAGVCDEAIIGPSAREWDMAAVVLYPSRAAFLEMVSDPDYLAIAEDRTAGLADSRLIPCAKAMLGA